MSFFVNPYPNFTGGGGSGGDGDGGSGTVRWDNVTEKPQTYPPSKHDHNDIYFTKEETQGHMDFVTNLMEQKQGKVATHSDDTPDFLGNKVDNVTIEVADNELKVKSVDGLLIGTAQLNTWLSGTSGNIQNQINNILNTLSAFASGMDYRGKFETYADLNSVSIKKNGDLAVVLSDEDKNDSRTLRIYNESLEYWEFVGAFEFSDEFIALSDTPSSYVGADGQYVRVDETNNQLVFSDIDYSDLKNKPNSTITAIDDAVSKRHEHPNISELNSIGIIEENGEKFITLDGIPYEPKKEPKEVLSAYLNSAITVNANDYIKWNAVKPLSTIPYDPDTGLFTLTPGKSYKVFVSVMGEISNYITIHFARGAEKVKSAPYSVVYGATTVNNRGGSGTLVTTFTIGESSAGLYGILVGEIGGKESVQLFSERTMLYIEEIDV